MTTYTEDEMRLAEVIYRKFCAGEYNFGGDYAGIECALAAIRETTERAAKLMDHSTAMAGERSISADKDGNSESARNWAAAMVTCENAANALRNGEHLK